ncbi:haloacid dehalogenase [Mycolicibacter longobardus]|uniref:Haloacid dehalogenase n=1 Tax=Mycolicibacter longobardus TaxID=1108812 RepID=A0A1X1YRW0_9MYCO|nr:haloacid dehalogenase [Mycolicibacter longobardus]MCV7383408.1 haloacid dehalogenase [Mycolicibacter longobardus]ORW13804.1 haloacid dehalogenase [Mycolicibacter longobardus]
MQITTELATWTGPGRPFWWDQVHPDAEVYPLQAVIFDLDALADDDGEPQSGLADLVLSLFATGIWVAVVGAGPRDWVQPRVRELLGDGMAETVISADDLTGPAGYAELYRLALWELGIVAGEALVIAGSEASGRTAAAMGLPVIAAGPAGYDGLLAAGCRELQAQRMVARFSSREAG